MGSFKERELVLCVDNPHQYSITQGKTYEIMKTGTRFTRVIGDNGLEQKMLHRQAASSFKRTQSPAIELSPVVGGVGWVAPDERLERLRALQRECECGAWIVRGGHSSYCPCAPKGASRAA